ncbi:MAG: hypothetical protein LBC41_12880 [Clostridiales bacterium]|jgi:putative flippase GtrA|nr:hypothetical protein [Clostridiales bacterium]
MDEKGLIGKVLGIWRNFSEKHKTIAQFIVFFALSNGVTVLQMIMLIAFKAIFGHTALVETNFRIMQIGRNLNGSDYFIFDYAAGSIASGGGGGLAYFLAVEVTLAIAQVINFFAQRNITFKANNNPWWSAMWYVIAYIGITLVAAAAQGLYKAPVYNLLMNTFGWGATGEAIADVITMFINSAISFWVFFPIFKVIFKNDESKAKAEKEHELV